MQALLLEKTHDALSLHSLPPPTPGPGEALVRIHAAALNHRDVWIQKGQYAGIQLPVILGSDGAGAVSDLGDGVDEAWLGKEVVLNPSLHWGASPKAQGKGYRILGMPDNGTFAEYVVLPVENLALKPAHLSWEAAAALPLAGLTAYRALFSRAALQPGEQVLVTGIGGGVALLAMQLALAAGAKVWVTSGSDEKCAAAQKLGAAGGANYRNEHWYKDLQQQAGGFDMIVDSAGGEGFNRLLDLSHPGGRVVFFGGTAGNVPSFSPQKVFWKQLTLLGSTMGHAGEFADLLSFVEKNQLSPLVDSVYPLAHGEMAMRKLEQGAQMGKIVLSVPSFPLGR